MEFQTVAIHAAKRKPTRAEIEEMEDEAFGLDYSFKGLFGHEPKDLPLGGIVAVAKMLPPEKTEELVAQYAVRLTGTGAIHPKGEMLGMTEVELSLGNYGPGRYGWPLTDVRAVPFIPCMGQQGFWELEPDVSRRLLEALAVQP
ncbi:MAG: hypothetical protein ACOYON_16290 [Fimbriimonas sp.]